MPTRLTLKRPREIAHVKPSSDRPNHRVRPFAPNGGALITRRIDPTSEYRAGEYRTETERVHHSLDIIMIDHRAPRVVVVAEAH